MILSSNIRQKKYKNQSRYFINYAPQNKNSKFHAIKKNHVHFKHFANSKIYQRNQIVFFNFLVVIIFILNVSETIFTALIRIWILKDIRIKYFVSNVKEKFLIKKLKKLSNLIQT